MRLIIIEWMGLQNKTIMSTVNPATNTAITTGPSHSRRLREAYIENERRRKIELAVVGMLWLVGCPVLSFLPATKSGSLWGQPDEYSCNLNSYSASSSMSGTIPKVYGSIMAPLFAVLVVQRSSNGLCSILKLGWLAKYSPLVPGGTNVKKVSKLDANTYTLALRLWSSIEVIEFLGYVTGGFLIGLVACDSKDFPITHVLFASIAFGALLAQNYIIGRLGEKFPTILSNWTSRHASRAYWLGFFHSAVLYFLLFGFFGPLRQYDRCDDFLELLDSWSVRVFGDTETMRWLASVGMWYNEYAFGAICIYVQLLEHFETQLWDFVGENNMPYVVILSRFSFTKVAGRIVGAFRRRQLQASQVELFLGITIAPSQEKGRQKVKGK